LQKLWWLQTLVFGWLPIVDFFELMEKV
jgi:hypothetical protein